jgi:hypothetical protein
MVKFAEAARVSTAGAVSGPVIVVSLTEIVMILPDTAATTRAGPVQPKHVAKKKPSVVVTPSRETHAAITPAGVSLAGQASMGVPISSPFAVTLGPPYPMD